MSIDKEDKPTNGTPQTVRELYFYIKSEFSKMQSIQVELTEHKNNHWKMVAIIISALTLYTTVFSIALKYIFKV